FVTRHRWEPKTHRTAAPLAKTPRPQNTPRGALPERPASPQRETDEIAPAHQPVTSAAPSVDREAVDRAAAAACAHRALLEVRVAERAAAGGVRIVPRRRVHAAARAIGVTVGGHAHRGGPIRTSAGRRHAAVETATGEDVMDEIGLRHGR